MFCIKENYMNGNHVKTYNVLLYDINTPLGHTANNVDTTLNSFTKKSTF